MTDVATYDPFDESLWGEYARMLLVGTAACTVAAWAIRLSAEPSAVVMILANLSVLAVASGRRFSGLLRLSALTLLLIGLVVTVAAKEDGSVWWNPLPVFSPAVTIAALGTLAVRDGLIVIRSRTRAISPGKIVVGATVFAASMYMVVIPGIDAFLEMFRERSGSYTVEDLSPLEVLRVRSAKLAVFAVFAYAGACVGSFLNVVASSAPRGEPIALRSSACPKCGTPIRRFDNLPIFSYLWLRGCCRDCGVVIPTRYFTVEVVGFGIFASLFLFELITGAANVPGFREYHYAGIIWIILYTKWPVVGIYLFHVALFSCLVMLALMEQERLRVPRWMTVALPVIFAGFAISFPCLLPVSLVDQTPFPLPAGIAGWPDRALSCLVGGAFGWAVGCVANSFPLRQRRPSTSLPLTLGLLGIALGWQAVLTIAVLWLATVALLKRFGGRLLRPRWLTATTLLFVIAMLHHPAWKWLAGRLSF